jgi:hypothetical protein
MSDLSKGDKKAARAAIDKGLDAEFREGLENFEAILKDWRSGKFETNKEAYHKLFKAVDDKDSAISRWYNGLTGGKYLITVAGIYRDGYIAEEDIAGFREETREVIKRWAKV